MSMLPTNLTLYRFPSSLIPTLDAIDTHLPNAAMKPLGSLELSTRGFVSPFGRGENELSHRVGDCILLAVGGESKMLPSSVVNEALAVKLDGIREREGRSPGGKERKRLKDEVLTDLLPRAFARPSRVSAYLDLARGWLVIDTLSRKVAESVVTALREALGSFPALPVHSDGATRSTLTRWLWSDSPPEGFERGDEAELIDGADGAVVKVKHHDLDAEEVGEHVRCGKQCVRLGMVFEDRLAFVIGEDLVVRKLRFLEAATDAIESQERDSIRAEIDATFALYTGEVGRLLDRIETELQLGGRDA